MLKVRRALISVWEKKGLIDFARRLKKLNIEIVSTGKTAELLAKGGVEAKTVKSITGFPEFLSGRVKTLHPKVFGGILANKKHPLHMEELRGLGIGLFDMVVVNLYPFRRMVTEGLGFEQIIEYIDIGGPSMLRAGAKNFKNIACLSSPSQYRQIIEEMEKNRGCLGEDTLMKLAIKVFHLTKDYDSAIYSFLRNKEIEFYDFEKVTDLRYGENPHQKAGFYLLPGNDSQGFCQHQGKELSYNNFLDLDAAFRVVREFTEPAASVIKHCSPCGVAADEKLVRAFVRAHSADPVSGFGGIVGLNRKVDGKTAREILKSGFKECLVAPGYSKEALKTLSAKKNIRVVEIGFNRDPGSKDIKNTVFGYLIQEPDKLSLMRNQLKVVTRRKPTPRELKDLVFAWKVVKYVRSNAVVLAKNHFTLGIGGGQPSRVESVNIALKKSVKSPKGAVMASDGFFPQPDSIKLMKKAGVKAVIQPGGSIKDQEVIEHCNKANISMIFTGIRHFRH